MLKSLITAALVTLASQVLAPAWAATNSPLGPAAVVAGTNINPFCIALEIKGVRKCQR